MSPYWLVAGLTPAQGAAANAFMSTGMSISSVIAFRQANYTSKNKHLLYTLLIATLIGSMLGAYIVPHINVHAFKYILAFTTIAALPLLFFTPHTTHYLPKYRKLGIFLAITLLMVGSIITSSAFSILFALTLMAFFNLSVLQMTAMRRSVGIVQSIVLLLAFTLQGFLIWQHAFAGFVGGSIGSYIGTKYAIKKSELFAKYALAIMSIIGAIALLI